MADMDTESADPCPYGLDGRFEGDTEKRQFATQLMSSLADGDNYDFEAIVKLNSMLPYNGRAYVAFQGIAKSPHFKKILQDLYRHCFSAETHICDGASEVRSRTSINDIIDEDFVLVCGTDANVNDFDMNPSPASTTGEEGHEKLPLLNPARFHLMKIVVLLAPIAGAEGVAVFRDYLRSTSNLFRQEFLSAMILSAALTNEELMDVFDSATTGGKEVILKECMKRAKKNPNLRADFVQALVGRGDADLSNLTGVNTGTLSFAKFLESRLPFNNWKLHSEQYFAQLLATMGTRTLLQKGDAYAKWELRVNTSSAGFTAKHALRVLQIVLEHKPCRIKQSLRKKYKLVDYINGLDKKGELDALACSDVCLLLPSNGILGKMAIPDIAAFLKSQMVASKEGMHFHTDYRELCEDLFDKTKWIRSRSGLKLVVEMLKNCFASISYSHFWQVVAHGANKGPVLGTFIQFRDFLRNRGVCWAKHLNEFSDACSAWADLHARMLPSLLLKDKAAEDLMSNALLSMSDTSLKKTLKNMWEEWEDCFISVSSLVLPILCRGFSTFKAGSLRRKPWDWVCVLLREVREICQKSVESNCNKYVNLFFTATEALQELDMEEGGFSTFLQELDIVVDMAFANVQIAPLLSEDRQSFTDVVVYKEPMQMLKSLVANCNLIMTNNSCRRRVLNQRLLVLITAAFEALNNLETFEDMVVPLRKENKGENNDISTTYKVYTRVIHLKLEMVMGDIIVSLLQNELALCQAKENDVTKSAQDFSFLMDVWAGYKKHVLQNKLFGDFKTWNSKPAEHMNMIHTKYLRFLELCVRGCPMIAEEKKLVLRLCQKVYKIGKSGSGGCKLQKSVTVCELEQTLASDTEIDERFLDDCNNVTVPGIRKHKEQKMQNRDANERIVALTSLTSMSLEWGIQEVSTTLKLAAAKIKNENGLVRPNFYTWLASSVNNVVGISFKEKDVADDLRLQSAEHIVASLTTMLKDDMSKRDTVAKKTFGELASGMLSAALSSKMPWDDSGKHQGIVDELRRVWINGATNLQWMIQENIRGYEGLEAFCWNSPHVVCKIYDFSPDEVNKLRLLLEGKWKRSSKVLRELNDYVKCRLALRVADDDGISLPPADAVDFLVKAVEEARNGLVSRHASLQTGGNNTTDALPDGLERSPCELVDGKFFPENEYSLFRRMAFLFGLAEERWVEVPFLVQFVSNVVVGLNEKECEYHHYHQAKRLFGILIHLSNGKAWFCVDVLRSLSNRLLEFAVSVDDKENILWLLQMWNEVQSTNNFHELVTSTLQPTLCSFFMVNGEALEIVHPHVSRRRALHLNMTSELLTKNSSALWLQSVQKELKCTRDDLSSLLLTPELPEGVFAPDSTSTYPTKGKGKGKGRGNPFGGKGGRGRGAGGHKRPGPHQVQDSNDCIIARRDLKKFKAQDCRSYAAKCLHVARSRSQKSDLRSRMLREYVQCPATSHEDIILLLDELFKSEEEEDTVLLESAILSIFETDSLWQILSYLLSSTVVAHNAQRVTASLLENINKQMSEVQVVRIFDYMLGDGRRSCIGIFLHKQIVRSLVKINSTQSSSLLMKEWVRRKVCHKDVLIEIVKGCLEKVTDDSKLGIEDSAAASTCVLWAILEHIGKNPEEFEEELVASLFTPTWQPKATYKEMKNLSQVLSFQEMLQCGPSFGSRTRQREDFTQFSSRFQEMLKFLGDFPQLSYMSEAVRARFQAVLANIVGSPKSSGMLKTLAECKLGAISTCAVGHEDMTTLDRLRNCTTAALSLSTLSLDAGEGGELLDRDCARFSLLFCTKTYATFVLQILSLKVSEDATKNRVHELVTKDPVACHFVECFKSAVDILLTSSLRSVKLRQQANFVLSSLQASTQSVVIPKLSSVSKMDWYTQLILRSSRDDLALLNNEGRQLSEFPTVGTTATWD